MKTTTSTAPPLGVIPNRWWVRHRFDDLCEACNRFMIYDKPIPREWIDEMKLHYPIVRRWGYTDWGVWLGLEKAKK